MVHTLVVAAHFVLMIGISEGVKPPVACLDCVWLRDDNLVKCGVVDLNNDARANIAMVYGLVVI